MEHELIAHLLIGGQKCMIKRNLVNQQLTSAIKLMADYVMPNTKTVCFPLESN